MSSSRLSSDHHSVQGGGVGGGSRSRGSTVVLDESAGATRSWRDLVAFFICGLVNNFAYVVMLSAAEDLLKTSGGGDLSNLTSLVLLCDILPSFFVQTFAPWYMQYIPYWLRVLMVVSFMVTSFLLPAFTLTIPLRLAGVVFASLASGFGEITFLAMTSRYHKDTVSAFSSGTGGAGVAGALIYLVLRIWLTPKLSLIFCSPIPLLLAVSYFFLMTTPNALPDNPIVADLDAAAERREREESRQRAAAAASVREGSKGDDAPFARTSGSPDGSVRSLFGENGGNSNASATGALLDDDGLDDDFDSDDEDGAAVVGGGRGRSGSKGLAKGKQLTLKQKIRFMPNLFPYMAPLFLVYFSEYLINQGVAPVLYWPHGWGNILDKKFTYLLIQLVYQVGVFISRSSVNFFPIRNLWIPAIAQTVNLLVLSTIAIFNYVPSVWIALVIILWEGLMGGAIYVNAFYKLSQTFTGAELEYAMGATSMSYATSITLAAVAGLGWTPFLAQQRHNFEQRHAWPWSPRLMHTK